MNVDGERAAHQTFGTPSDLTLDTNSRMYFGRSLPEMTTRQNYAEAIVERVDIWNARRSYLESFNVIPRMRPVENTRIRPVETTRTENIDIRTNIDLGTNPFNAEWTLPYIVLGRLKSSVGADLLNEARIKQSVLYAKSRL